MDSADKETVTTEQDNRPECQYRLCKQRFTPNPRNRTKHPQEYCCKTHRWAEWNLLNPRQRAKLAFVQMQTQNPVLEAVVVPVIISKSKSIKEPAYA